MAGMISPEGEHHEIVAEGVAALEALGWEREESETRPRSAKK